MINNEKQVQLQPFLASDFNLKFLENERILNVCSLLCYQHGQVRYKDARNLAKKINFPFKHKNNSIERTELLNIEHIYYD